MSISKLIILFVTLSVLLYVALGMTLCSAIDHVDNNGGVEQLLERVWNGNGGGK